MISGLGFCDFVLRFTTAKCKLVSHAKLVKNCKVRASKGFYNASKIARSKICHVEEMKQRYIQRTFGRELAIISNTETEHHLLLE